jgi:hypothetical protein
LSCTRLYRGGMGRASVACIRAELPPFKLWSQGSRKIGALEWGQRIASSNQANWSQRLPDITLKELWEGVGRRGKWGLAGEALGHSGWKHGVEARKWGPWEIIWEGPGKSWGFVIGNRSKFKLNYIINHFPNWAITEPGNRVTSHILTYGDQQEPLLLEDHGITYHSLTTIQDRSPSNSLRKSQRHGNKSKIMLCGLKIN